MLASSLTMVGYVWFKYTKHAQLEYKQMSEANEYIEKKAPSSKKSIAA